MLQRIAIAYLITAVVVLLTGVRGQVLSLLGLLLGYWTLMTLVPVPGVGRGVLEPEKNLSNWLDFRLLGVNHVWHETADLGPGGAAEHDGRGRIGALRGAGRSLDPLPPPEWTRRPSGSSTREA